MNGGLLSMSSSFLAQIRAYELTCILSELPASVHVLEIGAGSGWQAALLAANGFNVEAIDLADSVDLEGKVWPVRTYDGRHIPFPDGKFDVLFSSNVLEHIPHIDAFQGEMHRVLKPDGLAIHILPSSTWRFWTNIFHYFFIAKILWRRFFPKHETRDDLVQRFENKARQLKPLALLKKAILPARHGACGNFLTEFYGFSRFHWRPFFERHGWEVRKIHPNHLFYTGFSILGDAMNLDKRRIASRFLGSACMIYVLRNKIRQCQQGPDTAASVQPC